MLKTLILVLKFLPMQNLLAQLLKTKFALVVFLMLLSPTLFSQNKKVIDEKKLILSQEFKDASFKKREVKFFSLPFILMQIYSTNRFKLKLSMKRRLKV